MKEPVIEKNVPIPNDMYARYCFHEMEVGDSMLITGTKQVMDRAATAARVYGSRNGVKFHARKQDRTSVRIWRVA